MRLVIFAISLVLLLPLTGCGDGPESLIQLNSQKEANEVLVALARGNVTSATVTREVVSREDVWTIKVRPEEVAHARELLLQYDLPHERHSGYDDMLANQGIIPSPSDDRARLMHAMAGELERTFELYDQVVSARVHVVLPQSEPLRRRGQAADTPTALVVIKYLQESHDETSNSESDESNSSSPIDPQLHADQEQVELRIFGAVGQVESMVRSAVGSAVPDQVSGRSDSEPTEDNSESREQSAFAINVQFTPAFMAGTHARSSDQNVLTAGLSETGAVNPLSRVVIAVMASLAALTLLFMGLYLRERKRATVESVPQIMPSSSPSEFTT